MRAATGRRISIRMMVAVPRTYLVECYTPGIEQHAIEATARRARAATKALRAEERNVQYVNAILVPDDEVVFHVFSSDDPEAVREASVRAEVPFERIVESIAVDDVAVGDAAVAELGDERGAGV